MGSQMDVEIKWRLDAMSDLAFKVTSCHVIHGDLQLFVVKDECYSDLVAAQPLIEGQFNQGTSFYLGFLFSHFPGQVR